MHCKTCLNDKPMEEFYASNKSRCKECVRAAVLANRLDKIDYYRRYDRARSSMPHRIQQNIRVTKRWRLANPQRWSAQIALNNAIRAGKIKPLPCFICGEKAEAHHPDYSRPLDVVWLCPAHHKQAHAMYRKEAA
jgi:hypothetical protein